MKSTHFLAIWKFYNNGKPSLMSNEELPQNDVYLKNVAEARTQLTQVEASTEIEMLGIRKLATLCKKEEMKYIKSKARQYVKAISSCPLRKHE
eukprot:1134362-Ditylum_brightwellii.AAC.1